MRVRRTDDGVIAVIVAVFAMVMFALGALVVDLGLAREARREAQSSADAAALAAAGELYDDTETMHVDLAVRAAKRFARANFGVREEQWSSCTVVLPPGWTTTVAGTGSGTSCIAFDSGTRPTKVQVVMPGRHTASLLGGVVGYEGMDVSALAQAGLTPTSRRVCALCVFSMLEVDTGDVIVTGGGDIAAGDGQVQQVNGSVSASGGGAITFQETPDPASGAVYSPQPQIDGLSVSDPFVSSSLPTSFGAAYSSDTVTCGSGGISTLAPGVYRDIAIRNGTCTLKDGLFVVTGTLTMESNPATRLSAANTTLFFACGTRLSPRTCASPGETGGQLDFQGNGSLQISRWHTSDFSVLYDPWNTSPLRLAGNATATSLGGSLYARRSTVTISGNGAVSIANQMVVDSLDFNGNNTSLTVSAAGLADAPGPPELRLVK